MKVLYADLWSLDVDVRCVTTNGTTIAGGNVMGAGCALEAASRYPDLPGRYGALLRAHGNHVFLVEPGLVMFPVKHHVREQASLRLIERSLGELRALADVYGWTTIALPAPGAGHGGLDWNDQVRPLLETLLHGEQRIVVVRYPTPAVPAL